ncbi:ABC transporter ATP-binding protein [Roseateles saccharophilus]|uniref:ATP-binding cassette subfamily B protein n=1 Tax=Roseateles saccharophilus TaxID=304 RepID=A0A4R3U687_ROSSA|nr:ABC transporter ATP-binding protein [Roseateles saccharophilus]MDG0835863.1 ABC transporter ATP-binding protein [Roseateles saccharophilus]TCU83059.1 ATP-binding cassette subfamily B protein [Roseateles saccharophilus]
MPNLGSLGSALHLIRTSADRTARLNAMGALLLVVLGGTLAAGSPLALKHLVDAMATPAPGGAGGTASPTLLLGAAYLVMLVAGRLASDVRPLLVSEVEQRVIAAMRQRFFAHLQRLPMSYLVNRRSSELVHAVDLAIAGAQATISHLTNSIAPVLIELALMAIILAQLHQPGLVALFVATSALYLAAFAVGVMRQRPAIQAMSAASLDVYAQLGDGISHVETLRCFGASDHAEKSLDVASSHLRSQWRWFNRLTLQSALAASVIFAATLAACFAIASNAVAQGRLSVGGFVLASIYMLQMVRPLEVLGAAARDLSRAAGFMRPLLGILAQPTETLTGNSSAADRKPPTTASTLRLENLHFGYDPQRPIIRGLDLDVLAGRTTAIVGRSGSGKSTLVRLLLRLYEPQAGRILMDGLPIDSLQVAELRTRIGLVPQDTSLLQASVSSNIALGLPEARHDAIECAARRAQIHGLIAALPHGYGTLLGDRGQTLSGGERQRLAIARAMLREPSLYVLDEPTSMLDAKTEAAVLQSLRELTAGCTTLVIAHRLSTVMHADEIVVLDGGRVHERGSHAQLLAQNGLYAQLWRQQTDSAA